MLFRASESQSTSEQTLITPAILFLFYYCPNLMNLWELWAQFLSCVNPRFKFLSIEQNISTKRTVTSKPLQLPPPLQRKKEKKENINNCNTKMYEIWKVTSWTAVSEFAPLVLILWFKTAMVNMLIIPYVKCDVNTTPSQFISSELGQYTSKWCQKV